MIPVGAVIAAVAATNQNNAIRRQIEKEKKEKEKRDKEKNRDKN